ncbi:MAG: peptidylprolyl isomerase [Oscillatoria sp. SIO1A7]|nr:peptidylprolyl isomerase [Oscillatoria sp. SIO1A7]
MDWKLRHAFVSFTIAIALLVVGCSPDGVASQSTSKPKAEDASQVSLAESGCQQIDELPKLEGKATVVLEVKGKPIKIEVDGTNAPMTAGNFVDLVERGIYNGLAFHRVVRDPKPFVVQGGDPQGKDPDFPLARLGTGGFVDPETGQRRYICLEIKPEGAETPIYSQTFQMAGIGKAPQLQHSRGAVAMARSQAPDSASSQFYITLAAQPFLDGNYAVFGYVTEGMDVVDEIEQGDRIESATVIDGLENLKN